MDHGGGQAAYPHRKGITRPIKLPRSFVVGKNKFIRRPGKIKMTLDRMAVRLWWSAAEDDTS